MGTVPKTKRTLSEREALVASVVPESINVSSTKLWSPELRDAAFTWATENGTPTLTHTLTKLFASSIGFTGPLWKTGETPPRKGKASDWQYIKDANMRTHIRSLIGEFMMTNATKPNFVELVGQMTAMNPNDEKRSSGDVDLTKCKAFYEYVKAHPRQTREKKGSKNGAVTTTIQ